MADEEFGEMYGGILGRFKAATDDQFGFDWTTILDFVMEMLQNCDWSSDRIAAAAKRGGPFVRARYRRRARNFCAANGLDIDNARSLSRAARKVCEGSKEGDLAELIAEAQEMGDGA